MVIDALGQQLQSVKLLPKGIDRHVTQPMISLNEHGRLQQQREPRGPTRDFFEVDARHVVAATLSVLAREAEIDVKVAQAAFKDLGINPDKANPATV